MPTARWHLSAAEVNGVIYFIGGQARPDVGGGCVEVIGTVEAYDTATKLWTTRQSMSVPRYDTGIAVADNKIYVFGGNDGSDIPGTTVEVYDPATDQWASRAPMPTAHFSPAVGVVNDLMYVTCMPDTERLRVHFRTNITDGEYKFANDIRVDLGPENHSVTLQSLCRTSRRLFRRGLRRRISFGTVYHTLRLLVMRL